MLILVMLYVFQLKKLLELRLNLVEQYKETVSGIAALQSQILEEELAKWKRNVQLAGNGAPFPTHLDSIQEWSLPAFPTLIRLVLG